LELEPAAVLDGTRTDQRPIETHRLARAVVGIVREWGVGVVAPRSYPVGSASAPLRMREPTTDSMPTWPSPEGKRCITIELDEAFVAHLDTQAAYYGSTRAAFLRTLIRKDMDRLARGPAPARA